VQYGNLSHEARLEATKAQLLSVTEEQQIMKDAVRQV
jgi:hypothetical protein